MLTVPTPIYYGRIRNRPFANICFPDGWSKIRPGFVYLQHENNLHHFCCGFPQERRPELYASAYDFEYRVSANNYRYLVPVAHNRISEETLRKKVSGQGWKTTAVYQINQDKEVIKEYVLVTGGTISSARNETSPDYLFFSEDGRSVSFYEFSEDSDRPGAYETDPFTYDATDNAITLPIWYGSWGGNGRLVFLSSDTMVCVCTHDKDYAGTELIFMEILQRVSKKERQSWIDRCPNYGLRY